MGDPGAVVSGAHFAQLVLAHACHSFLVRLRIVTDGDLRGHASHGMDSAAMAGVDEQLDIGAQERLLHGDGAAVGQHKVRTASEFLDETKNVIPAPAVQPDGVVAQFVEDFIHFKSRGNGLDQHGSADGSSGHSGIFLGKEEDVIPQPRFEVALEFGQIEIGAGAPGDEFLRVVEEIEAEIEQCA